MRRNDTLYRMIITAVLLALGLVLPFLTGQLQTIGKLISPLHIPVLICGLTCGWLWGGVLGAVLPLLRMALFGMPAFPMAMPMTFELCAYGVLTGLVYPWLCRRLCSGMGAPRPVVLVASLALAMVAGRIVGGIAKALLIAGGVIGSSAPFTFVAFVTAYFVDTAVAAAIHLVVVPAVVLALEKTRLSPVSRTLNA
ncbi:MAG: ECF transporter S component [Clostridiales bacterium]|nr:ECF transporter S component [Clostridiales bacterium]